MSGVWAYRTLLYGLHYPVGLGRGSIRKLLISIFQPVLLTALHATRISFCPNFTILEICEAWSWSDLLCLGKWMFQVDWTFALLQLISSARGYPFYAACGLHDVAVAACVLQSTWLVLLQPG